VRLPCLVYGSPVRVSQACPASLGTKLIVPLSANKTGRLARTNLDSVQVNLANVQVNQTVDSVSSQAGLLWRLLYPDVTDGFVVRDMFRVCVTGFARHLSSILHILKNTQ